jgi:hypothetical protein
MQDRRTAIPRKTARRLAARRPDIGDLGNVSTFWPFLLCMTLVYVGKTAPMQAYVQ